jgi:D-alanyl-D-alanine dipeptidase
MPSADARLKHRRTYADARAQVGSQPKQPAADQHRTTDSNLPVEMPAAAQLTAPLLLRLQRLAGNRAVGDLLSRASPAVQRVTLGWKEADADSWNAGAATVNAKGGKAAAGEAGIVRIPVSGISAGHQGAVKGEMGGGSDPNIDYKAKKKTVAVSTVTDEAVGDESGGRAIVIVPQGLPPGKVDILFHLHGHTIGYRQVKHKKGTAAPPPRDVQYDRIEQQLLAAAGEGLPMVGILPQGAFYSEFGSGGQAGVNADKFIDEVLSLGVPQLTGLERGRVTLSGWSGAGYGITQMIGGSQAAAAGKKVPGGKNGSLLPTSEFEGLFLFDAIYGNWLGPIWDFLQGRLQAELTHLAGLGGAGADPAKVAAAQDAYLASDGFRFRGMYTLKGGCKKNYEALRDQHLGKEWFDSDAVAFLPEPIRDRWKANYEVKYSGAGVVHNVMIGKEGGPDQENLLKAIEMLPKKKSPTAAHGRAVPAPAAARRPLQQVAPPRRQPAPIASGAGDVNGVLVEAAAALGRAGKGSSRPQGGTLLHQEDLRAALANRAKNDALNQRFGQAVAAVNAVPDGPARVAAAQREAAALVRVVELQFILDPARSSLDLLPPDRTTHWRDFQWERNDYPGGPTGAHERDARRMTAEMTKVRSERRPNQGSDAVLEESQATSARWAFITERAHEVKGQSGQRLFEEAGGSFATMHEAAKQDGVKLHILDGFRTHQRAEANAKKAGNRDAVASFSSHSLGLAMDLEMSAGSQHFLETTTKPMQNVADMRSAPAHKWMMMRGEEYGWYPFGHEPWHWEYNPPGLRERFFIGAPPGVNPAATAGAAQVPVIKPVAAPVTKPKAASKEKQAAAAAPAATPKAATGDPRLSGAHWTKQYPGSARVDSLIDPFKNNVITFMGMLHSNKAGINVAATYRPPERAWLMHWAWYIAKGKINYSKIATIKNPYNVEIEWDHGDKQSTVAAAQAMVDAYKMKHKAALASRHTEGRAIDMTISHLPEILRIDGQDYPIGTAEASKNEALWFISDHQFAVKKLASDPPHWSEDGG